MQNDNNDDKHNYIVVNPGTPSEQKIDLSQAKIPLGVKKVIRGIGRIPLIFLTFIGFIFVSTGLAMIIQNITGDTWITGDTDWLSSIFSTIIGVFPLAIGIRGLVALGKSAQSDDLDGDGIGYDRCTATKEQMRLIEHGMRELGQFYKPPRKRPNQMQARETLRHIQQQLDRRKRTDTNSDELSKRV